METRKQIVDRVELFCRRHDMSEWAFGMKVIGDHRFIPKIREGKATLRVIERAEKYMAEREAQNVAAE